MVNELRDLLRDNVSSPPPEDHDLSALLRGGRRRVRRRRLTALGGTAVAAVAVVGLSSLFSPSEPNLVAAGVPAPDAPTLRLADAQDAVEGADYRVLTKYTNENLNADNGQYFDGVTDDGLVVFRDGPRQGQRVARYALMDPVTGDKDWLPDLPEVADIQLWPVDLGADRLVLTGLMLSDSKLTDGDGASVLDQQLFALVYDRAAGAWQRLEWPDLPGLDQPAIGPVGPDGRLYVLVPATSGGIPPGGWPTGPDGEADDADAQGDTYALWSVSLTDPSDARDEELSVGDVAFTDTSMVWTDSTNGNAGRVHVRDLETGDEHSFDPRSGEKCNLLSFGATGERIMMSQYCGTYDGGVRDDRVQVLSTDGDQVVTLQDSSIDGALRGDTDVVTVVSSHRGQSGTYVYDLGTGRFLRLSEADSAYGFGGGGTPEGYFLWSTPENRGRGSTQWLAEQVD